MQGARCKASCTASCSRLAEVYRKHVARVQPRGSNWGVHLRCMGNDSHRTSTTEADAEAPPQRHSIDNHYADKTEPSPQHDNSMGVATQVVTRTTSASDEDALAASQDGQSGETSFIARSMEAEMEDGQQSGSLASPALALVSLAGIVVLLGGGYLLKDQLKDFLDFFIQAVDDWGPWGYFAYSGVYIALEVLAVPAIPLTMTAGVIFGPLVGTAITCASGTIAATIAFIIARYAARDRVLEFAKKNKKFAAIDRAIGKDGFKFVTLLRLSPLFPFAASNYLYGLTAVDLGPYVAGSFLGMLPGTYAYVSAGHIGKAVFTEGEGSLSPELWQVALGLGVTLAVLLWVGQVAKKALDEVEE